MIYNFQTLEKYKDAYKQKRSGNNKTSFDKKLLILGLGSSQSHHCTIEVCVLSVMMLECVYSEKILQ